jgi:hypothetical protein
MTVANDFMNVMSGFSKMHRRDDPDTSREAAEAVAPHMNRVRIAVVKFATHCGYFGFTDYELNEYFMTTGSTYRSRRSELADLGLIIDSGRRKQQIDGGRNHIVWVHVDFAKETK